MKTLDSFGRFGSIHIAIMHDFIAGEGDGLDLWILAGVGVSSFMTSCVGAAGDEMGSLVVAERDGTPFRPADGSKVVLTIVCEEVDIFSRIFNFAEEIP